MNNPEENILLCVRVEDLKDPKTSCVKTTCEFCKQDVWVDQNSLDKASENELPVKICCNKCLLEGCITDDEIFNIENREDILKSISYISKNLRSKWK